MTCTHRQHQSTSQLEFVQLNMWKLLAGSTCLLPQVHALLLGTSRLDISQPTEEHRVALSEERVHAEKPVFQLNLVVHNNTDNFMQHPDITRKPWLKADMENFFFEGTGPCEEVSVGKGSVDGFPPQLKKYDVRFTCQGIHTQDFVNEKMKIYNKKIEKKQEQFFVVAGDEASLKDALFSETDLRMAMLFKADDFQSFNDGSSAEKIRAMLAGLFPDKNPEKDMWAVGRVEEEFCTDKTVLDVNMTLLDGRAENVPKAAAAAGFNVWMIQRPAFDMDDFYNSTRNVTDLRMAMLFTAAGWNTFKDAKAEKIKAMLARLFPDQNPASRLWVVGRTEPEFCADKTVVQYMIDIYNALYYGQYGRYNTVSKAAAAAGFNVWQVQTRHWEMDVFENGKKLDGPLIFRR